jgi:hypothetical protein
MHPTHLVRVYGFLSIFIFGKTIQQWLDQTLNKAAKLPTLSCNCAKSVRIEMALGCRLVQCPTIIGPLTSCVQAWGVYK